MATRLLKFTGDLSGEKVFVLPDGTKVRKGYKAEVDPQEAIATYLRRDAKTGKRDWEPVPRGET